MINGNGQSKPPSGLTNRYRHTQPTRFRARVADALTTGSTADFHYRNASDFFYSAELAREMDRSDPIFGMALTRLCDMLVQDGFGLTAQTGFTELDDYLEPRWQAWTERPESCDVRQMADHAALTHLVVRSVLRDGDVFKLPRGQGRFFLEFHRCRTPREMEPDESIVHGVQVDRNGMPTRFWFSKADIGAGSGIGVMGDVNQFTPVQAFDEYGIRQVSHLVMPKRLSQTRGVSVVANVADFIGMHDDIQFAKLVQQQAVSAICMFHQFAAAQAPLDPLSPSAPTVPTDRLGQWFPLKGIAAGLEYYGQAGEELKALHANVPNPEYFQHVMLILGIIATNLGIPVQVLLLDPTQTNFSGWRGAIDQAKIGLRRIQDWIACAHYSSDYRWWLQYLISTDETLRTLLQRYGFDFGDPWGKRNEWAWQHEFHAPAFPYIQPEVDIRAGRSEIAAGFTSPRRYHARNGSDHYKVTDEAVMDNGYVIEQAMREAQRINKLNIEGQWVDWREIRMPVSADTPSMAISEGPSVAPASAGGSPTSQITGPMP